MLRLRQISIEDTSNIIKWRNNLAVKSNLFNQNDLTDEQHLDWLEKMVFKGRCMQYIISISDKDVGTTFIKNIDKVNMEGEFGIFIGEDEYRGQGYGFMATKMIVEKCFKEHRLKRIYLNVFSDNYPAIMTYKRVGFKEVIFSEGDKQLKNGKEVIMMEIRADI